MTQSTKHRMIGETRERRNEIFHGGAKYDETDPPLRICWGQFFRWREIAAFHVLQIYPLFSAQCSKVWWPLDLTWPAIFWRTSNLVGTQLSTSSNTCTIVHHSYRLHQLQQLFYIYCLYCQYPRSPPRPFFLQLRKRRAGAPYTSSQHPHRHPLCSRLV